MNPFSIRVIRPESPFCDRQEELKRLVSYAQSNTNVIVFSPRRYGKTSLVRRVQHELRHKGFATAYVDFQGIASVRDIAGKIMTGVFEALHARDSLLEKGKRFLSSFLSFRPHVVFDQTGFSISAKAVQTDLAGIDLLAATMKEISRFLIEHSIKANFVFDEFQEITRLQKSGRIEAVLRSEIQTQSAGYFFVGSRRSILLSMFIEEKRPFFQSAVKLEIPPLPRTDAVVFLQKQFARGDKHCPDTVAGDMVDQVLAHPYYMQSLALEVYESTEGAVSSHDVSAALERVVQNERFSYTAIIQGLTPAQVQLLKGIAALNPPELMASSFVQHTGLSASTISRAKKKLLELDLIEQEHGRWKVLDPLFRAWLRGL